MSHTWMQKDWGWRRFPLREELVSPHISSKLINFVGKKYPINSLSLLPVGLVTFCLLI